MKKTQIFRYAPLLFILSFLIFPSYGKASTQNNTDSCSGTLITTVISTTCSGTQDFPDSYNPNFYPQFFHIKYNYNSGFVYVFGADSSDFGSHFGVSIDGNYLSLHSLDGNSCVMEIGVDPGSDFQANSTNCNDLGYKPISWTVYAADSGPALFSGLIDAIEPVSIPVFGVSGISSSTIYQSHFNVDNNYSATSFDPLTDRIYSIQIVKEPTDINPIGRGYAALFCQDDSSTNLKTIPNINSPDDPSRTTLETVGMWTSNVEETCPIGTTNIQFGTGGDETWWSGQVQIGSINNNTNSMIQIDWTQPNIGVALLIGLLTFLGMWYIFTKRN